MQIESKLSNRTQHMQANALREILKVVAQSGMISLAGGNPAPESFPIEIIRQLTNDVLDEFGPLALQYDKAEGFEPLRQALIPYLTGEGVVNVSSQTLGIFSGSQSVLDLAGKILISPGDKVVIEAPTYVGAIAAFNPYEPHYLTAQTDEDGVIPESLEALLREHKVKLVYLMPTFQNPTGRSLPLARRQQVAELLKKYDVLMLEDDPYHALRYNGEALPPVQSFAPDHVIYSSTFSKVLSPGMRLGYCVAPPLLARWLIIAKQGADLHTQGLGQAIAALYLSGGYLNGHLPNIINLYRTRRDAMLKALETHMPSGFTWSHPEGGMFIWVTGPEGLDTEVLYHQCVRNGVAFVPGKYCYVGTTPRVETLRLNFTMVSPQIIQQAIQMIAANIETLLLKD